MPVVRTDGRPVGVRSRDYQIFSDGYTTTFSQLWGSAHARCEASRVELRYEQARWDHGNGQKAELGAIYIEEFANLYCKLLEGTKS